MRAGLRQRGGFSPATRTTGRRKINRPKPEVQRVAENLLPPRIRLSSPESRFFLLGKNEVTLRLATGKLTCARMIRPLYLVSLSLAIGGSAAAQAIDFNTQIRPILNQNCTACHGGVKAAGEISFVYREAGSKIGKKSKRQVIVPGNPDASEMIARVSSTDKEYRMPPADHGAALAPEKIALLREWIKQGAPWQDHWAFVPPTPQAVPNPGNSAMASWVRGP